MKKRPNSVKNFLKAWEGLRTAKMSLNTWVGIFILKLS